MNISFNSRLRPRPKQRGRCATRMVVYSLVTGQYLQVIHLLPHNIASNGTHFDEYCVISLRRNPGYLYILQKTKQVYIVTKMQVRLHPFCLEPRDFLFWCGRRRISITLLSRLLRCRPRLRNTSGEHLRRTIWPPRV